jgi:hypothetical protein
MYIYYFKIIKKQNFALVILVILHLISFLSFPLTMPSSNITLKRFVMLLDVLKMNVNNLLINFYLTLQISF